MKQRGPNLTMQRKSPITFPKQCRTRALPTALWHKAPARQQSGRTDVHQAVAWSARKIPIQEFFLLHEEVSQ